jgi:hypothetical protein
MENLHQRIRHSMSNLSKRGKGESQYAVEQNSLRNEGCGGAFRKQAAIYHGREMGSYTFYESSCSLERREKLSISCADNADRSTRRTKGDVGMLVRMQADHPEV